MSGAEMGKNIIEGRKGVFFSGDALFAVLIIFLVLLVVVPNRETVRHETEVHQDILNSLSVLKVGEVDNGYVADLINRSEITDLDNSLLEQIGEFSVMNVTRAREMASAVLGELNLSENVGLWYGGRLVFSSNSTPFEGSKDVDTARHILGGISGDEENESVTGFSARAYLSSSLLKEHYYFGGYVGDGNISFVVDYAGNISNASLEGVVRGGNFDLFVNSNLAGTYAESVDEFTPVNYYLPIDDFNSGENVIEIKGDSLHIAGGFLKIIYEASVEFNQSNKYRFPGIEGLINLYDGFYVPGILNELEVFLHINSSATPVFLTIGNVTVLNKTTVDEELIIINNDSLSILLGAQGVSYADLSEKTVPIRLGLENVSYVGVAQEIDVFSVTDLSGSMCLCSDPGWFNSCLYNQNRCEGNYWACSGVNTCTGGINDVKPANNLFIDLILNNSGNRIGLIGYASDASVGYHALSTDNASLKAEVSSWSAGGDTCICCGINAAVNELITDSTSDKFRSMVVMSDGQATVSCVEQGVTGDLDNNGVADEHSDDAIQAACDAYNDYNITVHSIGFGAEVDDVTLQEIKNCAGGTYAYTDLGGLEIAYQQIAENIIAQYSEQTLDVVGNLYTHLFEDSYIEFGYVQQSIPQGLVLTLESNFSDSSSGSFSVPSDGVVIDTRVTSYSGPRWTDYVSINNNEVYSLTDYGSDYLYLGDPYIVNIPNSLVLHGSSNVINLTTGVGSGNSSVGSLFNEIILTIVKNASSFSDIKSMANGCIWSIEFVDGSVFEGTIPPSYSGVEQCVYNSSYDYAGDDDGFVADENDALQLAVLNLLRDLDVDSDGKVDFLFTGSNLEVSLSEMTGIPFTWSSEVQARRWI
ncbi:MAG: VWA domain-containing protein [archaeon]